MSSRKVVTDPSFKGKGTSDVSGNVINQLSNAVSDMNVHSAQDDGWQEYGKKSKSKNKNTALKQWGPQHSNPKAWGNSDTLQKLGLQSHGGLGRGSGQTRPMAPPDPRKHPGRGFIKPQSSSNQAPDPHYFVPPAVVPLPLNNGRGWPARPASVNPVSNQVPVNDEVDDGGEESEDVDDTDDELLSDGFDSDESQKSHETRKKNRWFKDLFHSLDGLTVEQINEPERQWHCPACKDGPGAIDWYRGLLPLISHAKTKRSKRVKLHRELAELLEEELKKRGTSAVPAGEIFGKWKGLAEIADKEIVWPPMVIVMNTRLERDENEKWIGMGNQELLDYFSAYSALKARHSYGPQGHRGMSVLIFEASAVGYAEAERLSKHFEDNSRDRVAWERNRVPFYSGGKRQLYGYMAEKQDMDNFNQHSQGKTKLKFEMRSYQEMVVSQMKQMSEDNQQLIWLKNKVAKEQKNNKALEESLGVVTEKLRRTMDENRIVKLKTKTHHEQNKEEKSGDAKYQNPQSVDRRGDHEPYRTGQVVLHLGNKLGGGFHVVTSGHDSPSSFALESDLIRSNKNHAVGTHVENQIDSNTVVGSLNMTHGGQVVSDSSGVSQILSQSTTLFTPTRYQQESILDSEFRYSGRDLISVADSVSKQDIVVKIRENEEEILHLKKHLTEYSRKEAQISNEKYALENRISYMRLAFDQKQQDFVLATSEAVSYRQDIMEENVRLTYTLQAAQQERSAFITSLMPLLTGYSLQPPVADAQSIVSNIKVLFRHLQEQLLVTEGKLKESQYQLAPWRSDVSPSNFAQSSIYPIEIKDGLELVPQPTYSDGNTPSSDPKTVMVGDIWGLTQSGVDNLNNLEHPPLASRSTVSATNEVSSQLSFSQADPDHVLSNEGTVSKKVTFGDLFKSTEVDEPDNRRHLNDREPSVNWNFKASATTTLDDPSSSYSPYLPPVLEEPSSSFSEAADDDPLPAIEGLQISGEAFPGQQLQACGYSINGTTSCNFEWVRHLEDGSFSYIDGAKQPNYLVTADDVGTYLAIEVQPLDDRKRKGELVKVFANEHMKITCDPVMHKCIEKTLYTGHASYQLSLSIGFIDIWEPALLAIKRDGYSIKCNGPSGVIVTEKFSSSTTVSIPYGSPTEFSIVDSLGAARILRVDDSLTDISGSRDTIVLTLRLFILKAGEKKRKKRSIFFNK